MWVDMIAQDLLAAGKKQSVSRPCFNLHEALKVLSFKQKHVELHVEMWEYNSICQCPGIMTSEQPLAMRPQSKTDPPEQVG